MMSGLLKELQVVSYPVVNWQQAKRFYGETLGLPVAAFMGDEVGWMEFGEKDRTHLAISLWRDPTPPKREGGATVVFSVDDAYKAIEELRRRGVMCEDVEAIPDMVAYANCFDPEGNRFQIAGPPPKA